MPALRSELTGVCTASTMPTTTMRAGVLLPSFSRAMSPSVETITVDPRAAPIQSTTTIRLDCRGSVGLKPPRNQKPASIQRRMLGCRNDRAFNARQKHVVYMIRQCVADDHLPFARKRERRGNALARRSRNACG